jgi:hypothetical protein
VIQGLQLRIRAVGASDFVEHLGFALRPRSSPSSAAARASDVVLDFFLWPFDLCASDVGLAGVVGMTNEKSVAPHVG